MESTAMKQLKYIPTIILAAMLATTFGCASTSKHEDTTPKKESAGEYIDDAVITTKVKKAIFDESSLKSSEINVETYKGVVQLSGFVSSAADIKKAVELARGVKGVTSVKNDMRLKPKE
jgi:osmotically-inducible protein OsmY